MQALCTKTLAFTFALLFLPALAFAQTGQIAGTVFDDRGEPLPGANVVLQGTTAGAAVQPDGAFLIEEAPVGQQVLVASILGYETARQEVAVEEGETVHIIFRLVEQPIEISEIVVERVMLTGGRRGLDEIPGSAHYLGPRELEKFSYSDVHRVLASVPGVYVQEEDGYGLRPNIGLRGTGSERSAKITVMEDGVLIAPAPYAAPSAYYFPTVGRMQAVEVRKGSSQVKYGPYTTGGALNLISTQIPNEFSGRADVLAGEHDARTIHASVGDAFEHVGFLLETYQAQTAGFKHLDNGGETGFDKKDYLAKLRFNTSPTARVYQALTFKFGYVDETSDETYLGLTEGDFARTPFRRYAGSQEDVMQTEHRQYQVRHLIRPTRFLDVTTTLYRTEFARNWYKLDKVRAAEGGGSVSIASLLDDPTTYAAEYALVTGQGGPTGNALEVKANNRAYYAQGVQSVAGFQFDTPGLKHDLEVGLRYHVDEIDRFQWVDLYQMQDGLMTLAEAGEPGTESNRVEQAKALAAFAQGRAEIGRLLVVPGVRFEHITLDRRDYGKNDPGRTTTGDFRQNEVDVWIPGVGLDYRLTDAVSVFTGVHKGFSPPGSQEGTKPEASVNYELGGRFRQAGMRAEAVAFFNDYSNLLGADLNAAGGTGTGDQFNGGAVDVRGLELAFAYDLGRLARTRFSLPLHLAYTFTEAEFQRGFESEFEPWGTVQAGDALPYLPKHQFAAGLGLDAHRFGIDLSARYVSRIRTVAGQGDFVPAETIGAHFVVDLSADVRVMRYASLFASVRNLTDEVYAVARRPAGLRPGLPRAFLVGIKTRF